CTAWRRAWDGLAVPLAQPPRSLSSSWPVAVTTGALQWTPSGERLTRMEKLPGPTPRVEISHMRCSASYATDGSEARLTVPGGVDSAVSPGSAPVRHVRPASVEVANPTLEAAPSS